MSSVDLAPDRVVRVGFIAAASIAKKNWAAIFASCSSAPDTAPRCVVSAVAARAKSRAEDFIAELQAQLKFPIMPVSFGSYDELINSKGICDAIYVAAPMCNRYPIILSALQKGLHVVTEKPVADSMQIVDAMYAAAHSHNAVLMDGTMLSHGKRIVEVGKAMPRGITSVSAAFSFPGGDDINKDIRTDPKLEHLGALGDVGWYCVRYVVDAMTAAAAAAGATTKEDEQRRRAFTITRVSRCSGLVVAKARSGVNTSFSGLVQFETAAQSTILLTFFCSMVEAHQQHISFRSANNGVLTVEDFCLPFVSADDKTTFSVTAHTISNEKPYTVDHVEKKKTVDVQGETSTYQEENMWRQFASVVTAKTAEEVERANRLRNEWERSTRLTSEALAMCYHSAVNKDGAWVSSTPSLLEEHKGSEVDGAK